MMNSPSDNFADTAEICIPAEELDTSDCQTTALNKAGNPPAMPGRQ